MNDANQEELDPQNPEDESPDSENGDESAENGESEDSEDLNAAIEALKEENASLKKDNHGLSRKLKKVSKSKPKVVEAVDSTERLDKLELRQLDSELDKDQMLSILQIKEAKGYEDVSDAYNDPMVQAFLEKVRTDDGKQEKIQKAIPKATGRNANSAKTSKRLGNQTKNWGKQIPSMTTQEAQDLLAERFNLN